MKTRKFCNEIYDKGNISKDMLKSAFRAFPKKAGETGRKLHRTISIMSQVTGYINLEVRNDESLTEHLKLLKNSVDL